MKKAIFLVCLFACLLMTLTACGNNVPVSKGTISGNTYESEFLDVGFMLPEGFTFATDEQIAEQYGVTYDETTLSAAPMIYDMFVADNNGNSVSVTLEAISQMSEPVSSPKRYLQNLSDMMGVYYDQMNAEGVDANITTVSLAGRTLDALTISVNLSGINLCLTYACEVRGDRMVTYSVMALDEALNGSLINRFYALDATV